MNEKDSCESREPKYWDVNGQKETDEEEIGKRLRRNRGVEDTRPFKGPESGSGKRKKKVGTK